MEKPLKVIFFFGLPGSGKGTQADLLVDKYGFFHFDTGKEIERIVHDPANMNDPVIVEQRRVFDAGTLNDPTWVRQLVRDRVTDIARGGTSLVFSGSPRTLEEAEDIIPLLYTLFGKGNLIPVQIEISEDTGVYRNSHRRICEQCRRSVIWADATVGISHCPLCYGLLITRGNLDNADTIRNERIPQYKTRTKPVLEFLEKEKFYLIKINGEQTIEDVHKDIVMALEL